jgi:hypothetical protein
MRAILSIKTQAKQEVIARQTPQRSFLFLSLSWKFLLELPCMELLMTSQMNLEAICRCDRISLLEARTMSIEAQLARLALRLLADKPQEMQEVLEEFSKDMLARAAALRDGGSTPFFNREQILREFVDAFGSAVSISATDASEDARKVLERELSSRMHGLPEGATYKIE